MVPEKINIEYTVESAAGGAVPESTISSDLLPSTGTIADWASIIGLVISIYAACKIRGLSKRYLFVNRITDYKKQIGTQCSELNTQLAGNSLDPNAVAAALSLCLPVLKPLREGGTKAIACAAKAIEKRIRKAVKRPAERITRDFTETVQRELRTLESEIANHVKDRKATPTS
jgi:gas vesicle protein